MRQLFIRQKVFKLRDSYPVLDQTGKAVYQVEEDFKFFGHTVHVDHADGTRSFVIDKELFTFLPFYRVQFSDGTSMTIKQHFTFFKKEFEINSETHSLSVQGDFFDLNFDVYNGEERVGHIQREWLSWGDTFVISVFNQLFEEELLALLIVVDRVLDDQQRSNN